MHRLASAVSPRRKQALSVLADFLSTFLTAAIVFAVAAFVVLRALGWTAYSVDSYSMTPAYPVDSLVIVEPVEPEEIQVGDVVTYVLNEDGVLVTHRVCAIDSANRTFTTKGDANATEDASPVLWDNVVGKVVFDIPLAGKALRVMTAEKNRPVVIGAIVGVIAASILWDVVSCRRKRRKREGEEQGPKGPKHAAKHGAESEGPERSTQPSPKGGEGKQ